MMRHAVGFSIALLVAASISACKGLQMCGPPGQTQACLCSGGRHGAQVCLPERVWDKCDCSGAVKLDNPGADAAVKAGTASPVGTGGSPAASMTGASDAAMSHNPVASDSGTAPMDAHVADSSTHPAPSDAAADAMLADAHPDAGKSNGNAYKACSSDGDCNPSGTCDKTTDPTSLNTVSACEPSCNSNDDCPKPKGNYEASVTCDTTNHVCTLDCAPTMLLGPMLSCPNGMSCVVNLLGAFLCYSS